MPRPKVDTQNRRRALQACDPCKYSKKRCDSNVPCLNCMKKNDRASCIYSADKPRIPASVPVKRKRRRRSGGSEPAVEAESENASTAGARMLWTSSGTQVYVGDSASISFLHLLRNTLSQYMGPSDFTNDARKAFMLETRSEITNNPDWICCHDTESYTELVDTYFAATSGLLDVINRPEIMYNLQAGLPNDLEPARTRGGVLHTILAIGAQGRANGQEDKICEKHHLAKAQEYAFGSMLENLSIDMARLFLLLGFYMFGACRRNVAFMYIGVAARAASALGLNRNESYSLIESEEKISRLKTWRSIRILDLLVCATLGRSPATSDTETTAKASDAGLDEDHRTLSLNATFEILTIVDEIVEKFYRKDHLNLLAAKALLNKLELWSSDMPPALKTHTYVSGSKLWNQEVVLGNMHVACSYYYAVTLATRKHLVAHLTLDLVASAPEADRDIKHQPRRASESSDNSKLAQTCLESALLTLQACKEVLNANMLLSNMNILQVWIFTAGVIVGFAMFARVNPDPEMEETFKGGNSVLQMLSAQSPQAKLYFEILSNLHGAIKEYRRRKASAQESDKKPFVKKIFSVGEPSKSEEQGTVLAIAPQTTGEIDSGNLGWSGTIDFDDFQTSSFDGAQMVFENIDSVAVQLWDELVLGQDLGVYYD